jgi:protein ImuB
MLALWFPQFPIDRFLHRLSKERFETSREREGAPLVVVETVKNMQRLYALNEPARRLGLVRNMPLSTARAMYPDLRVIPADPDADGFLLKKLAEWCVRYTPHVGLDMPDGLFLDVTGVAHLMGGEKALLQDLLARVKSFGFQACAAMAPTPAAAFALARFTPGAIIGPEELQAALFPLPLAALRLEEDKLAGLAEAGLFQVKDIVNFPRAPLTARFGENVLIRLDQALARRHESINPCLPVPLFMVEKNLAEAVTRQEDILTLIGRLAPLLCGLLQEGGQGARRLEVMLFRVDGGVRRLEVGTSRPLRAPHTILQLFTDRLHLLAEDYDAGFGFEKIRLSALQTENFEHRQENLAGRNKGLAFSELIDRLGARLGRQKILKPFLQDTHIPEAACALLPANGRCKDSPTPPALQDSLGALRPPRLLAKAEAVTALAEIPDGPPIRFRFRRVLHDVALAEGPERIAMSWWRDDQGHALTRDYFRVESREGIRLWLYREGLYERETARPQWFVHGLFA